MGKLDNEAILKKLEEIVGKDFASDRSEDLYIYSQDPGASLPRHVDFVVMPNKTEEVQEIEEIPMDNLLKTEY